jgi:hypothetical protein
VTLGFPIPPGPSPACPKAAWSGVPCIFTMMSHPSHPQHPALQMLWGAVGKGGVLLPRAWVVVVAVKVLCVPQQHWHLQAGFCTQVSPPCPTAIPCGQAVLCVCVVWHSVARSGGVVGWWHLSGGRQCMLDG